MWRKQAREEKKNVEPVEIRGARKEEGEEVLKRDKKASSKMGTEKKEPKNFTFRKKKTGSLQTFPDYRKTTPPLPALAVSSKACQNIGEKRVTESKLRARSRKPAKCSNASLAISAERKWVRGSPGRRHNEATATQHTKENHYA